MKSKLILSFLAVVTLVGCKKEDVDTTVPSVDLFTINGAMEEVTVSAGVAFQVAVEVSDNEALGQFKLDIHDDFDGHTHGKNWAPWDTLIIGNISGTNQQINLGIPVPSWAAAGAYHATLRLIDARGNEAPYQTMTLYITNGSEPTINLTSPNFSSPVTFERGMSYALQGAISDDTGLDEIIIYLEEGHAHKTAEEPIFEFDVDLGGSIATWDFETDGNIVINIPQAAEIGDYILHIIAKDVDGNYGIFEGEIEII